MYTILHTYTNTHYIIYIYTLYYMYAPVSIRYSTLFVVVFVIIY